LRNIVAYKGERYSQVQKRTAEKCFNDGELVYLMPSRYFPGVWMDFTIISNKTSNFESVVNQFKYYNCTKETGKRVNYYIKLKS
jgi:hypothetical protein